MFIAVNTLSKTVKNNIVLYEKYLQDVRFFYRIKCRDDFYNLASEKLTDIVNADAENTLKA